ncbi:MAG: DUF2256 domain-containing protein [Elstera sp.]
MPPMLPPHGRWGSKPFTGLGLQTLSPAYGHWGSVSEPMAHKKLTLPSKICAACQRPFVWRKKWERDWEQVRYCSDRCRSAGPTSGDRAIDPPASPDGHIGGRRASRGDGGKAVRGK